MQVLEKILQEIEQRINDMASEARDCEEMEEYVEVEAIDHTISGLNIASNIIRSHMEDDGWIPVSKPPKVDCNSILVQLQNGAVFMGMYDGSKYIELSSMGIRKFCENNPPIFWRPKPDIQIWDEED